MMTRFSLTEYLEASGTIIDVRSPCEFEQGRIPSAINLPLFTNSERSQIGTIYKQQGEQKAIELGHEIIQPKINELVTQAKEISNGSPVKIHCWRGGMRSQSVVNHLQSLGISAISLEGGYKAFRKWALETLTKPLDIHVLGGYTGCGKTEILHALRDLGQQTLDLESLANHRGSSYGMIGMSPQPTTEQFQNEIAVIWGSFDPSQPVWIEDENRMIGTCEVPNSIYSQKSMSSLYYIERPRSERLQILKKGYGDATSQELVESTKRIEKRLGGKRTKEVLEDIQTGNLQRAAEQVLDYYDKAYEYALKQREGENLRFHESNLTTLQWAELLIRADAC